jgi:small subunit ribosomal protein S20
VTNAVAAGEKDEAVAGLKAAVPVIDAAVTKGIIHRNKAARHKSHLNTQVRELAK